MGSKVCRHRRQDNADSAELVAPLSSPVNTKLADYADIVNQYTSQVQYEAPSIALEPEIPLGCVECPQIKAWRTPTDRRHLSELLAMYAKPIKALAQELAPLIKSHPPEDPIKIDDVFLLRYLLSNQSTVQAAAAVRFALEYRREDSFLRKACIIAAGGHVVPWKSLLAEFLPESVVNEFTAEKNKLRMTITSNGDFVGCLKIDERWFELMEGLAPGQFFAVEKLMKEVLYQYLDFETRKRGYLVKCYAIMDYAEFRLNRRAWRLTVRMMPDMKELSELSSKLYPQLEAAAVLANSPLLAWLVSFMKPFVSERAFEKVRIDASCPTTMLDGLDLSAPVGTPCRMNDPLKILHEIMRKGFEADCWIHAPEEAALGEAQKTATEIRHGQSSKSDMAKALKSLASCLPCSETVSLEGPAWRDISVTGSSLWSHLQSRVTHAMGQL